MRSTAGATTVAFIMLVSPWLSARPSARHPRSTSLSTRDAPSPRAGHSAIWTGREMIVWGGDESLGSREPPFDTGGHYNPVRDTWKSTETRGAPLARTGHTAVWTGKEMIVWGGRGANGLLSDGGSYDPRSSTWRALSSANAPSPRRAHVALWTGTQMIVWGGQGKDGKLDDGARWEPGEGRWLPITKAGAPTARRGFAVIWSGKEMLVWGGEDGGLPLRDGAAYNPSADRWRALSQQGSPSPRFFPVAVWTGEEMLVWGGRAVGEPADDNVYPPREGSIFVPGKDSWTSFYVGFGWHEATIVWTGKVALLWGGFDGTNVENTGVRITP